MTFEPVRPQIAADGRPQDQRRGHGARSGHIRDRAVAALLLSATIAEAATRAGIGERTLRTWLASDRDFRDRVAGARQAAFDFAMARVQNLAATAVDAVLALLGEKTPAATRLGAARLVLEVAVGRQDAATILKRLEALEQAQRENEERRR